VQRLDISARRFGAAMRALKKHLLGLIEIGQTSVAASEVNSDVGRSRRKCPILNHCAEMACGTNATIGLSMT
jgi:hypothetical protein